MRSIKAEDPVVAYLVLGFLVTSLGPLEIYVQGVKKGMRGLEVREEVKDLVEALEALILEEGASDFADRPQDFPEAPMQALRPLPQGLTLTHVSSRPRFARTSEGVVLALDGISLIVPQKDPPGGGYVYLGNTMTQLYSQADLKALEGLLDAETAVLTPEAGPAVEVPHAVD